MAGYPIKKSPTLAPLKQKDQINISSMKKYLLLCITLFAASTATAQINVMTLGYQDDLQTIMGGGIVNNWSFELLVGPLGDSINDDSKSTFGLKVGYMFPLFEENGLALFLGPKAGYFASENFTQNTSESGLLYGGEAGIYFAPISFSVGYGMNDVTEVEYFSWRVGINILDLFGGY